MAFEMLDTNLPSGVSLSTLVALYQFDEPATAMQDRSGNGHHLDTYPGGGVVRLARGPNGERLWQNYNNHFAYTDLKAGVFNTLGALTVEWVAMVQEYVTNQASWLWSIGDVSTSASRNLTASLRIRDPDTYNLALVARHERGTNVPVDAVFDWGLPFVLHHGALTRAADGVTYKLWSDGELLQTVVASDPPENGTGTIRIILMCAGPTATTNELNGYMGSWRYCKDVEFTPDQIAESHDRIWV